MQYANGLARHSLKTPLKFPYYRLVPHEVKVLTLFCPSSYVKGLGEGSHGQNKE